MRSKNSCAILFTLTLSLTIPLIGELDTDWLNTSRKATRYDWDGGITQKDITKLNVDDLVYLQKEAGRKEADKKTYTYARLPQEPFEYVRGVISKKDATQNSLEIVCKGAGFSRGDVVGLKQVFKPHFNKLIMLIDKSEQSAGALTSAFIDAVHQKAAPILVSSNLIKNYLNIANDPEVSRQYRSRSLAHFELSEWIICRKKRFYLLIPKSIIPSAIQNNVSEISQRLGLYLEENGITLIPSEITTKSTPIKQQQEWLKYLSTEIHDVDFENEIKPFFREKVFIKIEGEKIVEEGSWIIYLSGHGLPNKLIAGFSIQEFTKFLDFISSKLTMSLLYYFSCYAGGTNLDTVKQLFEKDFDNLKHNRSFIIAAGALTDEAASFYNINFTLFFKNAIGYLPGRISTQKQEDPFNILGDQQNIANIANIYVPGAVFHKTIEHPDLLPITKTMIAAKIHPMETVLKETVTKLKDKGMKIKKTPSKSVSSGAIVVGNKNAVLYENNISVPVSINSGFAFIPKGRGKIYSFSEIITENTAGLFLNTPYIDKTLIIHGRADIALKTLDQRSFIIECEKLVFKELTKDTILNDVLWVTGKFLLFTHEDKEHAIDLQTPLTVWLKDATWTEDNTPPVPADFQTAEAFITYATKQENQIDPAALNKKILKARQYLSNNADTMLSKKIVAIDAAMTPEEKIEDAISNNHAAIISKLAQENVSFNFVMSNGDTPLTFAIKNALYFNNTEIIHHLIQKGADVNLVNRFKISPLQRAVTSNNTAIAQALIDKGAEVNYVYPPFRSLALHMAVDNEAVNVISMLIKAGSNLNLKNTIGKTPLHGAISLKNSTIAKLLIDAGTDLSITTDRGQTALDLARMNNHTEIVQLIEEKMKQKK